MVKLHGSFAQIAAPVQDNLYIFPYKLVAYLLPKFHSTSKLLKCQVKDLLQPRLGVDYFCDEGNKPRVTWPFVVCAHVNKQLAT